MTIEQLRSYHSPRTDSICPGHPEIEHEGVEVTTGPLGQGVANAVGMAMAAKNLGSTYNRPNYSVVDNMIWCMVGDACLQEGVALEAFSLAGHWKLNNLAIIYDNNSITCDGSVDVASSEDVNAKMEASGFRVIDVFDGSHDITAIVSALLSARASDKPTFINIRTIIGFGSKVAGNASTHGAALGPEDVAAIKRKFGMDPDIHFSIPQEVYDFFHEARSRGHEYEHQWAKLIERYCQQHAEIAAEFQQRVEGKMSQNWLDLIPDKSAFPTSPTPSRKSAGLICNPLAEKLRTFMVGTADLTPSVNMAWKGMVAFQRVSLQHEHELTAIANNLQPDLETPCGMTGDYKGRYIHWGIREHAMCSISNGIAAYQKGTILPVTSSFFMFYIVGILAFPSLLS